MHEYSIAQSVIRIVLAEAERAKARKVVKVYLTIGELTGVLPDSLSFCFELLSKATIAEGAALTIERTLLKGYCAECGQDFFIKDHRYLCHRCGNTAIELVSGRELQINQLEIEDEAD